MKRLDIDSLKLKAAVEFGADYTYIIKNGGLGPTLYVDATTKTKARIARTKIPGNWEGLYVIVLYSTDPLEYDEILCDPKYDNKIDLQ